MRRSLGCSLVVLTLVVFGLGFYCGQFERCLAEPQTKAGAEKQKVKRAIPQEGRGSIQKVEVPKDGAIYVWSPPAIGHQSLLVLGVLDGNTIDAAYLVPVRIRLKGVIVPGLDEKGGKEAQAALEKYVGGQLRTAQLWGPDHKTGLILADFWLPPEKRGEKGQWLSQILKK